MREATEVMYLKKTPNPNGRIRLSIVDTYYDKAKKCSRQKTIESIGWMNWKNSMMTLLLTFKKEWSS
mgnify:CR=1 FL=1